jgi:hypothetical protein
MILGGSSRPPAGDLLLLDDYIGSGATLKEAGRVLRKEAEHKGALVPLTIARIRWRLGTRHAAQNNSGDIGAARISGITSAVFNDLNSRSMSAMRRKTCT